MCVLACVGLLAFFFVLRFFIPCCPMLDREKYKCSVCVWGFSRGSVHTCRSLITRFYGPAQPNRNLLRVWDAGSNHGAVTQTGMNFWFSSKAIWKAISACVRNTIFERKERKNPSNDCTLPWYIVKFSCSNRAPFVEYFPLLMCGWFHQMLPRAPSASASGGRFRESIHIRKQYNPESFGCSPAIERTVCRFRKPLP